MRRLRAAASTITPLLVAAAMGVLAAACAPAAPEVAVEGPEVSPQRARVYAERLLEADAGALTDEEIIALGYLERGRIGLGSPFRLIDFALADPALSPETRATVAYTLLDRARRGDLYQVDPRVLELVDLFGVGRYTVIGPRQLELIERVVAIAPTPESGERMVRLGYRLARTERTVTTNFPSLVSHVAALVADRRRAREDADRLISAARAAGVSPLHLLPRWRAERRFSVEAPAMATLTAREEEAIATQGPRVAQTIRALAQRLSVPGGVAAGGPGSADAAPASLLDPGAAERLAGIAKQRNHPPQAPISVALFSNRDGYVDGAGSSESGRELRQQFIDGSFSEERFVAGLPLQTPEEEVTRLRLQLIRLQAAVFFRVWNQEEPWFPGDPAPGAKDLVARFRLGTVKFGASVPDDWHPYFRRMLASGLTEFERVLPTASLRGLSIRIDELPGERRALAQHDPASRTLFLPPRTGAGTLAHEIAHDLDWQLARKRYGARGYATDLAVNSGRGDRIAYALSGLAASLTQPDSILKPHDTRPTEVFARGTDWFVATVLARDGRAGGYLTSFQDPSLTGYGTTRGPDVGGGAVGSLLDILAGIAPVGSSTAEWALSVHGPQRRLTPIELAVAVSSAGGELPPMERFQAIAATRDHSLGMIDNAACRLTSAEGLRRLSAAQRGLIESATAAAARGAAIQAARDLGSAMGVERDLVDASMAARLYGAPRTADSALVVLEPGLEEIVYHVRELERESPIELLDPFDFTPRVRLCGGNPFASGLAQRRAAAERASTRR